MRINPIKIIPTDAVAVAEPPPAAVKPTTPPTPASGVKRVSFGKVKTKSEDKPGKDYPLFPDADGQCAIIAARILSRSEKMEALKGAIETDKAELKMRTTPHYFAVNTGRHEVPSSLKVAAQGMDDDNQPVTGNVLVSFINKYPSIPDDAPLVPILGERTGKFIKQSFAIKIESDKLPADKTQELTNKLIELFEQYGASEALEIKDGFTPTEDFHAKRHLELTVEENLQFDAVCPISAMVKTKNVK